MKQIGGVLQQGEFKGVLRAQKLYIWHEFDLTIKTTTLRCLDTYTSDSAHKADQRDIPKDP